MLAVLSPPTCTNNVMKSLLHLVCAFGLSVYSHAQSSGDYTPREPTNGNSAADYTFLGAINSGGSDEGVFVADTDFLGGGTFRKRKAIITGNGEVPADVYCYERDGNFTYNLTGLSPDTAHLLELHFAEIYHSDPGRRVFDVFINDVLVLDNFDIISVTGAKNAAVIETFNTISDSTGAISVTFVTEVNNAKVSGLALFQVAGTTPDPDSDEDGVVDSLDAFPNDPTESTDMDSDGEGDNSDAFPNDPAETTDTDGDGIGDNSDPYPTDPTNGGTPTDTDGDGVEDSLDAFPNDPTEMMDTDSDGVGNNGDAFPNDPTETIDSDGDGIGNNSDTFPNDPTNGSSTGETVFLRAINSGGSDAGDFEADTDFFEGGTYRKRKAVITGNGDIPEDVYRYERDGNFSYSLSDLVPNTAHELALHFAEIYFSDPGKRVFDVLINGTLVLENYDIIAVAGTKYVAVIESFSTTSDSNGTISVTFVSLVNDAKISGLALYQASGTTIDPDSDGDGVIDSLDAFPNDPSETTDTDGDGIGDNSDPYPNDPTNGGTPTDSDGDRVEDSLDAFPNDPAETADTDGDGIGDNSDPYPNDPNNGGTPTDSDGDGVEDSLDAFPNDPSETTDSDGDGMGDNSDPYPNDPTNGGSGDPILAGAAQGVPIPNGDWQLLPSSDGSGPTPRHENDYIGISNKLYLLGGRKKIPFQVYDASTNTWTEHPGPPIKIHHFQAVEWNDKIYIVGALTGNYSADPPVSNVYILDISTKQWSVGPEIPLERQRGAASAVVYNDKIYIVGGNTKGHQGGFVAWFDEFDPATGAWTPLADAPIARDHHRAAIVQDKLYVVGGRQTNRPVDSVKANTIGQVDVFDFATNQWSVLPHDIPTPRASFALFPQGRELIVAGGEAETGSTGAVEALDLIDGTWRTLPDLVIPRLSPGGATFSNRLFVAVDNPEEMHQEFLDIDPLPLPEGATLITGVSAASAMAMALSYSDGDGVSDSLDAFPNDPNETTDTDGGGVDDNSDAFPADPTETVDTDSDGTGDNADLYPNNGSMSGPGIYTLLVPVPAGIANSGEGYGTLTLDSSLAGPIAITMGDGSTLNQQVSVANQAITLNASGTFPGDTLSGALSFDDQPVSDLSGFNLSWTIDGNPTPVVVDLIGALYQPANLDTLLGTNSILVTLMDDNGVVAEEVVTITSGNTLTWPSTGETGTFDPATGSITWQITVNAETLTLEGVYFDDQNLIGGQYHNGVDQIGTLRITPNVP